MKSLLPSNASQGRSVLMIGPPADSIGGIASVARQMRNLSYERRYRIVSFHNTCSRGSDEPQHHRFFRHLRQAPAIRTALRREGCGIVHLHTCSGFSFFRTAVDMLAARRLGCRTVLHMHGAAFDRFHDGSPAPARLLISSILASADAVLALSESWRSTLKRLAPSANLIVVENAVQEPPALSRPASEGPCRFLFLARMDEWKGVDDLLAAARLCHDRGAPIEIVLAGPPGSAGDAETLQAKIRGVGLEGCVRYIGPVVGVAKNRLFDTAEALVMPSHCEGMPISLLEALAHALPVVATTVGSLPEVISDSQEGFLVPPRSPDRLADAMIKMAANRENRHAMGQNARRLAETRFSIRRFEKDLVELYDGLAEKSARMARGRS